MNKSTVGKLVVCLCMVAACAVRAAVYSDDFSVAHDYLADGVAGTVWDGFLYNFTNGNAEVTVANADIANAGRLTFRSTNGNWENGDADGILLYKNVAGDFDAMVRVVSMNNVQWHDAGIMARVADPDSGGPSEDWVAVKHFAQSGMNGHRSVDGNVTTTVQVSGLQPWLRLARVGNTFISYRSVDGTVWSRISSTVRNDMDGLPVQVGLWQATFSANEGTAVFDDFTLMVASRWSHTAGGSWANTANWAQGVPEDAAGWALFTSNFAGSASITLDGDRTAGRIVFNSLSSYSIEPGGGTPRAALTLDGAVMRQHGVTCLENLSGSHDVNVPVIVSNGVTVTAEIGTRLALTKGVAGEGPLTKRGAGTLAVPGSNTYSGATQVSGGTLKIVPLPEGTQAYYAFDDPGFLGKDDSLRANHLSVAAGAPAYAQAGVSGGAVYLNGASHFTRSVFPKGVPTGASPYTIALWIRDDGSDSTGGFCGWGNNAANSCNNLRFSGTNALNNYWYGNDWNLAGLTANPKDGQWHHVAVTWDGAVQTMYVDGAPVGSTGRTGLNAQAANFVVGKTTADKNFKGWMDNLLIASRALSAAEIDAVRQEIRSANPLPAGTALKIETGGVIDFYGGSQSVGGLSGAGRVMNGSAVPATLTVGTDNASSSFAGAVGGPLTLVKEGAGTLALSGVCGQSGGTLVNEGKLVLSTKSLDALLAGSRAWFDAADAGTLTTNAGGQVTLWKNKGTAGAGLDAVQVTAGVGPTVLTNALNGRPVLSVEGSTALRTTNKLGIYGAADRTLFAVGSRQNNSSNFLAHIGEIGIDASNKSFGIASQAEMFFAYTWGNDILFAARPNGVPEIYDFVIANGVGSASVISDEGVLNGTKTLAPNTTDTVLYMGSRGTSACWGHLAEVIVFDRALSPAEIVGVEEYLRAKWFLDGAQAVLSAGDVTVAAGAVVDLAGTSQTVSGLSGNGLVTNGTLTVAGTLAPGGANEIGTLTVAAAMSLEGGTLLVDAAAGGLCDRLDVKGSLNLDGGVLLLQDPSQFAVGKYYVIATCAPGELTGTLDPDFEGSGKWKVAYDTANGTVTLVSKGLLIKMR